MPEDKYYHDLEGKGLVSLNAPRCTDWTGSQWNICLCVRHSTPQSHRDLKKTCGVDGEQKWQNPAPATEVSLNNTFTEAREQSRKPALSPALRF